MHRIAMAASLLIACGNSPRQTDPAAKSAPTDPATAALRADVETFCGAVKATGGRTLGEIGPYLSERMKTDEIKKLFELGPSRSPTIQTAIDGVRAAMAKTGVTECDTLDVVFLRTTPGANDDALRIDVEMICGAAKATGGHDFMSIGPYIAERMKTDLLADLFAGIRSMKYTLDDFITIVRGAMKRTGVDRCDTVDVLVANDPRKKTE